MFSFHPVAFLPSEFNSVNSKTINRVNDLWSDLLNLSTLIKLRSTVQKYTSFFCVLSETFEGERKQSNKSHTHEHQVLFPHKTSESYFNCHRSHITYASIRFKNRSAKITLRSFKQREREIFFRSVPKLQTFPLPTIFFLTFFSLMADLFYFLARWT